MISYLCLYCTTSVCFSIACTAQHWLVYYAHCLYCTTLGFASHVIVRTAQPWLCFFSFVSIITPTVMAARWSLSPSSQSRQLWEVKEHPPDPGKYRKIGRTSTYLPGLSDLRCDSADAGKTLGHCHLLKIIQCPLTREKPWLRFK